MSIVKMKRLRLIGMRSEREEMLRLLQHMGCVEIDEPSDWRDDPDWASLTRPDTAALNPGAGGEVPAPRPRSRP